MSGQQVDAPGNSLPTPAPDSFDHVDLATLTTPLGLPAIEPIGDERRWRERTHLGRKLFFDPILSSDHSTSCATCHQPAFAFSTPEAKPGGVQDRKGRRHPPSLINRQFGKSQFWDGRAETLEEQALQPIESPQELDNKVEKVLADLQNDPTYRELFAAAFDDGITRENLGSAIAYFERAILSGNSKIDQFVTAELSSLTKSERQGLWLYESKGGCWKCHSGKTYTDESFHNTGVSWGREPLDLGRFEVTKNDEHKGQFKTPTLRDVELTAPYMHDGSINTLREVVEFYNQGGVANPHLDAHIKPLELTEQEIDDLVAFLKALTGQHAWDPPAETPTAGDSGDEP